MAFYDMAFYKYLSTAALWELVLGLRKIILHLHYYIYILSRSITHTLITYSLLLHVVAHYQAVQHINIPNMYE